jgi:hypothetical protein
MNYIKYYDNVLPKEMCNSIIKKFEDNKDQQKDTYLENHRSFTELNLNQNMATWKTEIQYLVKTMQTYTNTYTKDFGTDKSVWPALNAFEQLRIKRYLPNDKDEFKFHVDVTDHASAKRFLVFFWYLNDVEEGGETAFQINREAPVELKVQPKAGRLLMFPPLWTHPHVAFKPISNPKYIVGGYLHYV